MQTEHVDTADMPASMMRARMYRVRRTGPLATVRRAVSRVRIWLLMWEISSLEQWLEACERDGIYGTETMRRMWIHHGHLMIDLLILEDEIGR